MTAAEILIQAALLDLPELIKLGEDIAALIAGKQSGQTEAQAVEAARETAREAVDQLEKAATLPKP